MKGITKTRNNETVMYDRNPYGSHNLKLVNYGNGFQIKGNYRVLEYLFLHDTQAFGEAAAYLAAKGRQDIVDKVMEDNEDYTGFADDNNHIRYTIETEEDIDGFYVTVQADETELFIIIPCKVNGYADIRNCTKTGRLTMLLSTGWGHWLTSAEYIWLSYLDGITTDILLPRAIKMSECVALTFDVGNIRLHFSYPTQLVFDTTNKTIKLEKVK